MENARRITFFLISNTLSVAQSNLMLMILLINQWYSESQKHVATLPMSKKIKERFSIKKKLKRSCWVKKVKHMHDGKTSAMTNFQNLTGKKVFVCLGKACTSYVPNCTDICRRNRIV